MTILMTWLRFTHVLGKSKLNLSAYESLRSHRTIFLLPHPELTLKDIELAVSTI